MTRDLSKLNRPFDLLIVGGGIIGAGVAWDASLRGLRCLLVEQADFAGGTSSKTTKLIHGGIRYLENLQFELVRQAIRERQILLRNAPSLVKPLSFLIPVVGNAPRPWPLVRLGVFLYDLLAGKASIQKHRILKGSQVLQEEPLFSGAPVSHGALYTDAQMDDARLVLAVVEAASQAGCVAANYVKVKQWLLNNGKVVGAQLEDLVAQKSYTVQAKCSLNATGPWVDRLRKLADPQLTAIVRPSKGIHLVYPDVGLKRALLLSSARDNRIFFLIPWRNLTLIGTTDTDYKEDPENVQADSEDVEYLVSETNRLLPGLHLKREKIITTFAGIRPLAAQEGKDPWAVSRMHLVHEDACGLLSVVGGKFTTFRKIAQDAVDRVSRGFAQKKLKPCETSTKGLGAPARSDQKSGQTVCPHHGILLAEVRHAVTQEMALTLGDLFWRRWGIAYSPCQGLDALDVVAKAMGEILGWSPEEAESQKQRYRKEVTESRQAIE